MNDPNGMVFHRGVYHLFFQYNPLGEDWGNMSWGHASSIDLVHWTEHPVALTATAVEQIYSGSVVFDRANSSGLGTEENPPLVAVYTSMFADGGQAQSLAFSTDDGMTWTRYAGNPVLDLGSRAFRDPKVSWYAIDGSTGYWLMAVAAAEDRTILFLRSDDLKHWTRLSAFGPFGTAGQSWECPDLIPLPVDGDPGRTKWLLIVSIMPDRPETGSATRYILGDFDGVTFTPDSPGEFRLLDSGRDFYAAVTFGNVAGDRRILMGWMSNWDYAAAIPTVPWRGSMSLPRELSLSTVDGAVRLVQSPVRELQALKDPVQALSTGAFDLDGEKSFDGASRYRLHAVVEPQSATRIELDLAVDAEHFTRIGWDVRKGRLSVDRSRSGLTDFIPSFPSISEEALIVPAGDLHLDVWVDRASVEAFIQGGLGSLTSQIFPPEDATGIVIRALGGSARVKALGWAVVADARTPSLDEADSRLQAEGAEAR
jgi:sucrose-6-phosphate hydrolase SacC (GH32 family)